MSFCRSWRFPPYAKNIFTCPFAREDSIRLNGQMPPLFEVPTVTYHPFSRAVALHWDVVPQQRYRLSGHGRLSAKAPLLERMPPSMFADHCRRVLQLRRLSCVLFNWPTAVTTPNVMGYVRRVLYMSACCLVFILRAGICSSSSRQLVQIVKKQVSAQPAKYNPKHLSGYYLIFCA